MVGGSFEHIGMGGHTFPNLRTEVASSIVLGMCQPVVVVRVSVAKAS